MADETLADALAAARKMLDENSWIDEVTAVDEDGEPDDFAQRVVRSNEVRDALDRIEAAAERERVKARHDAEIEWTRIGYDERKAEERSCNAAAMREALEGIEGDCRVLDRKDMWEEEGECYYEALRDIRDKVRAALAAPARNCDIYPTAEEAYAAWQKLPNLVSAFARLFAPAEEGAE